MALTLLNCYDLQEKHEDENSLLQLGAENVCRSSAVSRCLARVYFPNSQFEDAA